MIDDYINERIKKLNKLKELGINPYPQISLKNKKNSIELLKKYNNVDEKGDKKSEKFAGRIISLRSMGNIAFMHLQDEYGKIQAVFQSKETKEYKITKLFDVGDIIIVKGNFFKTKRGEISLKVKEFTLASKSIRPLPEKFHGITDEELILRKRELDAIMNSDVLEKFRKKSEIIKSLREFMDKNGFLEVQTPVLQTLYGGASAEPFKTHHNAQDIDLFLRIAPELYLKRMITAGFEKVYELGLNFRNEGMDKSHLQEITFMEFYWSYQDYEGLMDFTEKLYSHIIKKVNNSLIVKYQGKEFNFKTPYKRITFRDLIKKHTGIDINIHNNYEKLVKEIQNKKIKDVDIKNCKHYGALLDEFYKKTCRPNITQPTFLTDYPKEMIPLAKLKENDNSKIATFQLIVNGWEMNKAYNELNDPLYQRETMEAQQKMLKKGDKEAHPLDEDFIESLEYGMPPVAGFGMGIDRLVMLLLDFDSVRKTIFFPLMKPANEDEK